MPEFKIQIEQLTEVQEHFAFDASAGWWAGREPESTGETYVVEEPFAFSLTASRVAEKVLIEGEMTGQVGLECSRCGKRYPHRLRDQYRLALEPVSREEIEDPEGERALAENGLTLGEDLEAGWYRGPRIRLDDFFGEVIALAMPIQPLCNETCLGICAHCGAARTSGSDSRPGCECKDEKIESPFAVLAQLKSKIEDSD